MPRCRAAGEAVRLHRAEYFQLLGNNEGLPEFVLANTHALITVKPSPAVANILSRMHDQSQARRASSQQLELKPAAPDNGSCMAEAGTLAAKSKQPASSNTASHKQGTSINVKPFDVEPPPGFAPLPSPGRSAGREPAAADLVPSRGTSSTEAGSSQAMQTLLSACMQMPGTNGKHTSSTTLQPAAQQAKPAVSTAIAKEAGAAPSDQALSKVVVNNKTEDTLQNGSAPTSCLGNGAASSPTSSASGIEAMRARSSASSELSSGSLTAEQSTAEVPAQQPARDPFCIDCIARPGRCEHHPLLPATPDAADEADETVVDDAAGSSECSSQVRVHIIALSIAAYQ